MAGARPGSVDRRRGRRWIFANCTFDEANWTLTVDGRRVAIESKPLELLRALLQRAGELVSKEELLGAIWPDVAVVEASLPTAICKLRSALDDDQRFPPIVETVPRIGYRLAVAVEAEALPAVPGASPLPPVEGAGQAQPAGAAFAASFRLPSAAGMTRLVAIAGGLAVAIAAAAYTLVSSPRSAALGPAFSQREAANALRRLDVGAVEEMLAAGWNPNTPFDDQGNDAINILLNMCEWNRGHDQSQLLLMVRTLVDGGARLDHRNVWGDTPYSIAKAQRYCGPNHPVTRSIRTMCYAGYKPLGDRCLATYELTRRHSG